MGPYFKDLNGKFSKTSRIDKSWRALNNLKFETKSVPCDPTFSTVTDHTYAYSFDADDTLTCTNPDVDDFDDICVYDFLPQDLVSLGHCRFIIELDILAKQLEKCTKCSVPLHLSNALGVRPMGVSGVLYLKCKECCSINRLKLGKTHHLADNKGTGVGIFDVNTKLAAGKKNMLYWRR